MKLSISAAPVAVQVLRELEVKRWRHMAALFQLSASVPSKSQTIAAVCRSPSIISSGNSPP